MTHPMGFLATPVKFTFLAHNYYVCIELYRTYDMADEHITVSKEAVRSGWLVLFLL